MRIELGRATGDVERLDVLAFDEIQDDSGDIAAHLLGAVRAGIHVAMNTCEIAKLPHVHL